jgi:hypothetical protein
MQSLPADGSLSREPGKASLRFCHETQSVEQSFDVIVLFEFFNGDFDCDLGSLVVLKKFEMNFLEWDAVTFQSFCHRLSS